MRLQAPHKRGKETLYGDYGQFSSCNARAALSGVGEHPRLINILAVGSSHE